MSTPAATKSGNLYQHKPASGAADYDRDLKQNQEVIDFLLGGLKRFNYIAKGIEITAGAGLTVNWSAGTGMVAGVSYDKTASSGSATDNSGDVNIHLANYVYLNNSGAVTISTTLPSSADYAALGVVFTNAGAIAKVVDCRKFNPDLYAADTGAANAYVMTLDPPLTAYVTGLPMWFKAANANTTASTANFNGLGAKNIKKAGNALTTGDILAGQIYCVVYDGTDLQLIGTYNALKLEGASKATILARASHTGTQDGSTITGVVPSAQNLDCANYTSTENAGVITLTVSPTTICDLYLGSVTVGDVLLINAFMGVNPKGATAGLTEISVNKASGTASIVFYNNSSGAANECYIPAGDQADINLSGVLCKITATGTLTLRLAGLSKGSNATISAGAGQISVLFLKKQ